MLPSELLRFKGHEIASETIFAPIRCFSEDRRQAFQRAQVSALRSFANLVSYMHLVAEGLVRQ